MSLHIPLKFVWCYRYCFSENAFAFFGNLEKDFGLLGFGCPDVLGGDETFSLQSAERKVHAGSPRRFLRALIGLSRDFIQFAFSGELQCCRHDLPFKFLQGPHVRATLTRSLSACLHSLRSDHIRHLFNETVELDPVFFRRAACVAFTIVHRVILPSTSMAFFIFLRLRESFCATVSSSIFFISAMSACVRPCV